jgi:hypothetical protein
MVVIVGAISRAPWSPKTMPSTGRVRDAVVAETVLAVVHSL